MTRTENLSPSHRRLVRQELLKTLLATAFKTGFTCFVLIPFLHIKYTWIFVGAVFFYNFWKAIKYIRDLYHNTVYITAGTITKKWSISDASGSKSAAEKDKYNVDLLLDDSSTTSFTLPDKIYNSLLVNDNIEVMELRFAERVIDVRLIKSMAAASSPIVQGEPIFERLPFDDNDKKKLKTDGYILMFFAPIFVTIPALMLYFYFTKDVSPVVLGIALVFLAMDFFVIRGIFRSIKDFRSGHKLRFDAVVNNKKTSMSDGKDDFCIEVTRRHDEKVDSYYIAQDLFDTILVGDVVELTTTEFTNTILSAKKVT